MQAVAEVQDTAWRTWSTEVFWCGVGWIDQDEPFHASARLDRGVNEPPGFW